MLYKYRFINFMLLILSVPLVLASIYYVINFQSLAYQTSPVTNPINNGLYLDGKTFYKVIDGQNKLKIGNNFGLEVRIRPETYFINGLEKSVIIARTSDKSLLDYYQLYLEKVIYQNIAEVVLKPKFKVKFNIKRYPTDTNGLTLESKTLIAADQWSTIKITRSQNQIYLYINGKLEDSRMLHGVFEYSRDGTNYIGAYYQVNEYFAANRSWEFFKGAIDYIKITDGNSNLSSWDFNCSLKNSISGGYDLQLYQGIIKFFNLDSGGLSTFTNGRCDKPVVPTPTPTLNIRLLPSPTPKPTNTPFPTFPNKKPYFESPDFIENNKNQNNDYIQSKKSLYPYYVTFVAKDDDGDNVDIKITLESKDLPVEGYLRILPGRPNRCVANAPTPTPNWIQSEKTITLCGLTPPNGSLISKFITVHYEASDGKPDGVTSGFYKIRVTNP